MNKLLRKDWKQRKFGALQAVPSHQKIVVAPPGYEDDVESGSYFSAPPIGSASMFPEESVIYCDEYRDMVLSTDYNKEIIRPLPIFVIAIGFDGGAEGENAAIPVTIHHGPTKESPIFATADQIDRHAVGTLYNHAYNPSAPFATTKIAIGSHLTKERCDFEYLVPTGLSSGDGEAMGKKLMKFRWKQCEGDPQVMDLGMSRGVEAHDWSWFGRENKRGMKLFCWEEGDGPQEESKASKWLGKGIGKGKKEEGEVLAVFVAGKKHSKMNPVRIAAKVRWLESELWTDELRLAAFLALMTYGEMTRRVGLGGGFVI